MSLSLTDYPFGMMHRKHWFDHVDRVHHCTECNKAWEDGEEVPFCDVEPPETPLLIVDEAELATTVDLRPGAVNYALQKDRDNPPVYVSHSWQDMTLVDFCEGVGIKLGPWQRQFLEELDTQRGLPNKG